MRLLPILCVLLALPACSAEQPIRRYTTRGAEIVDLHSYPPTSDAVGLERWDALRRKYGVPLWHGETGEQGPPYDLNRETTEFLNGAGVGWSWWTHNSCDFDPEMVRSLVPLDPAGYPASRPSAQR